MRGSYPSGLPRVLTEVERVHFDLVDGTSVEGMVVAAEGYRGVPTALCLDVGIGASGDEVWIVWLNVRTFRVMDLGDDAVFISHERMWVG
jgi:hypothetical protein